MLNSRFSRFGDIRSLNRSLLVCVRARLLADQAQLTHQPTHAKAANTDAILTQHTQNASAASRASTLIEQLVDLAAQCNAARINTAASKAEQTTSTDSRSLITGLSARTIELARHQESGSFFRIAFSRSSRSILASSSWIFCCSESVLCFLERRQDALLEAALPSGAGLIQPAPAGSFDRAVTFRAPDWRPLV